jgi:hypothetical protein
MRLVFARVYIPSDTLQSCGALAAFEPRSHVTPFVTAPAAMGVAYLAVLVLCRQGTTYLLGGYLAGTACVHTMRSV